MSIRAGGMGGVPLLEEPQSTWPSLGKLQACHTGTCVAGLKAPTASEIAVDRDVEKSTVLKT